MSAASGSSIPLTYAVIPFSPQEENWNSYTFSDGAVIRFRIILTRITAQKGSPPGQYQLTTNQLMSVEAPSSGRGQPTATLMNQEIEQADKYEVKPIESIEEWNVYRLRSTDDIIKIKYIANAFYKLKGKFDQFGEPMYIVNGSPLVVPQPKMGSQGKATP